MNRVLSASPWKPCAGRLVTTKRGLEPWAVTSALPITRRNRLQLRTVWYSNSANSRTLAAPLRHQRIWALAKRGPQALDQD